MASIKTEYRAHNEAITGMTDDEFYGREEALGVDLDACRRQAVRELRRALEHAVMGGRHDAQVAALRMRRTVYRLAVALGNQSDAEEWLYRQPLSFLGNIISPEELSDRAELDRATERQHPHPGLIADLRRVESDLAAMAD